MRNKTQAGIGSRNPLLPLKRGIRRKLFLSYAAQLGVVLGLVFSFVMALDLVRMRGNFRSAQEAIGKSIVAKGKHQALRTGMILAALPEKNFPAMARDIVAATVASDPDILYGIFMDAERKPLASIRSGDVIPGIDPSALPSQLANGPSTPDFRDEMSLWASGLTDVQYKASSENGREVVEFAAPVVRKGSALGIIRFGMTTDAMHAALHETGLAWRKTKELTIALFGLLGIATFLMALWSSSVLAERLTKPLRALTGSAKRMADGNYQVAVRAGGDDETAALAEAFEAMRIKIQGYTGNLQMLVEEKVKQIRDILDNVKQGLFTFDLDLNVNPDCSISARHILEMDELAGRTLAEVLRLSPQEEGLFRDWVEVVLAHHGTLRWEKLAKLAPVPEFRIGGGRGEKHVTAEYQKILDTEGRLIKIMALVQDVTETRFLELRMKEEKVRLENKVKTILAITGNPPETVSEFLKDSDAKIRGFRSRLERWESPPDADCPAWVEAAHKDCHTIKGNAGAFGFETLMQIAHDLETRLDDIIRKRSAWSEGFPAARKLILEMETESKRIQEIRLLLAGGSDGDYVQMPGSKVSRLIRLADRAGSQAHTPELRNLVEYCRRFSHRSFISLTRKYRDLVARAALKTGKEIRFILSPRELELDPGLLFRVDEALVHLLRNAAAHGIEEAGSPGAIEKGSGRIELAYSRSQDAHVFAVKDNGRGIDCEALVERAVATGVISRETAPTLGEKDKLQLIFHPGFSMSERPDSLSGRGIGLAIVQDSLKAWGGVVAVETWPGNGSVFTITLPA